MQAKISGARADLSGTGEKITIFYAFQGGGDQSECTVIAEL